jgi:hypothetical protein
MMEADKPSDRCDTPDCLRRSVERSILVQCTMRADSIVAGRGIGQQIAKVPFSQYPLGGRICGDIGSDELSPLQTQDDQPVEKLEPDGRNDEQINGGDLGGVMEQEGPPARRRRPATS